MIFCTNYNNKLFVPYFKNNKLSEEFILPKNVLFLKLNGNVITLIVLTGLINAILINYIWMLCNAKFKVKFDAHNYIYIFAIITFIITVISFIVLVILALVSSSETYVIVIFTLLSVAFVCNIILTFLLYKVNEFSLILVIGLTVWVCAFLIPSIVIVSKDYTTSLQAIFDVLLEENPNYIFNIQHLIIEYVYYYVRNKYKMNSHYLFSHYNDDRGNIYMPFVDFLHNYDYLNVSEETKQVALLIIDKFNKITTYKNNHKPKLIYQYLKSL